MKTPVTTVKAGHANTSDRQEAMELIPQKHQILSWNSVYHMMWVWWEIPVMALRRWSSWPASATQQVWGQPGLYKILLQTNSQIEYWAILKSDMTVAEFQVSKPDNAYL